jgi:hypothetical protein
MMSPLTGSTHRAARLDSGLARLWAWARTRRGAWTCQDAVGECLLSESRCRAIVAALHQDGLLEQVSARSSLGYRTGFLPATWRMSPAGRNLDRAPIMIVDSERGIIVGLRQ